MKVVKRAYKYRIYPTNEQQKILARTFGCTRFVYNWGLGERKKAYAETKKGINYTETSRRLTALKGEYEWLKEVSSVPLQQCLRHLDKAYKNFFAGRARYPRFKRRHARQSATFVRTGFTLRNGELNVAKMGLMKVTWSRNFNGEPSSLTVSRDPDGRYFVSLLVEEALGIVPMGKGQTGLDMGIKDVVVGSDGFKSGNPKYTKKYQDKLRREQKSLSRKVKGSSNRRKQRRVLGRIHARIRNSRKDFLHKLSTGIVRENQTIVVEDLNVKGMGKNRRLSKAIHDSGWGTLVRFLEYKSEWHGRKLVKVSPRHTSQDCSACGWRNEKLRLVDRDWKCEKCGEFHDRDINAARNILAVGTTVAACGDGVRPAA